MEINASAQSLLSQIRDYQSKIESAKSGADFRTALAPAIEEVEQTTAPIAFSERLSQAFTGAIEDVNSLQMTSADSQKEFQMGGHPTD